VAASKSATNENVQTDWTDCFVKPSISEIVDYIQEHNLNVDAKSFGNTTNLPDGRQAKILSGTGKGF
jgi:hypothetical protein